ncbi:transposase [Novosphingobium sp. SG751A]|nr:transposase [Novosphingobium sp. SG751A]
MPIESEHTNKLSTVGSDAVGSKGGWPRSDPSASGSSTSKTAQQESALESHHEHTIERMFGLLKRQRRIATRYDKTALSFLGFLNIAAARLWLKAFVNMS